MQITSLRICSPVVGLLPLASGQAFNSISSVNGRTVIPPWFSSQSLICSNRMYHWKVEVGFKIGEAIYCAPLSLTSTDVDMIANRKKMSVLDRPSWKFLHGPEYYNFPDPARGPFDSTQPEREVYLHICYPYLSRDGLPFMLARMEKDCLQSALNIVSLVHV
jgi:hypothetical protein